MVIGKSINVQKQVQLKNYTIHTEDTLLSAENTKSQVDPVDISIDGFHLVD